MWVSSHHSFWGSQIRHFAVWLGGEVAAPIVSDTPTIFEKLNMGYMDIIILFIKLFGHNLVFIIFSTVSIIIIFKEQLYQSKNTNLFLLSSVFILGVLSELFNMIGIVQLSVTRALSYPIAVSPIFVGYILYKFKTSNINKLFKFLIVVLLIVVSSIIGIFSLHPSPYTELPNDQVTDMELIGMKWFYDFKNSEIGFIGIETGYRFADAILGPNTRQMRGDMPKWLYYTPYIVPDHFNYTQNKMFGESFEKDKYMVLTKFSKVLYTTGAWQVVGRFTESDFSNLNYDKSVNKLYTNGDLEVHYVDGRLER
jgi:hypothetical protein